MGSVIRCHVTSHHRCDGSHLSFLEALWVDPAVTALSMVLAGALGGWNVQNGLHTRPGVQSCWPGASFPPCGCLGFLATAWRLGSKQKQTKKQEKPQRHFMILLWKSQHPLPLFVYEACRIKGNKTDSVSWWGRQQVALRMSV